MENKKIVIVGGGAAGFFCAIHVAELHPEWEIKIVEKSTKVLSKVRVSGGGRCNVTHACPDIEMLLKKYPRGQRFLKKSFYQFATKNTMNGLRKMAWICIRKRMVGCFQLLIIQKPSLIVF